MVGEKPPVKNFTRASVRTIAPSPNGKSVKHDGRNISLSISLYLYRDDGKSNDAASTRASSVNMEYGVSVVIRGHPRAAGSVTHPDSRPYSIASCSMTMLCAVVRS